MMKKVLLFMTVLASLTCCTKQEGNKAGKDISRDAYLQSLDSVEWQNSLITWTSDTAFTTNRELMLLLDVLYRHVREEDFPSEVRKEEKWMSAYRDRLVAYYDSHSHGNDSISIYAKADSVLNEGVRLLELGSHWSTMEMIVNNSTEFTYDRCREYGLLTQVINSCESEEAKNLVYQEWSLYERMLKKIGLIASNMVSLNYWGGSIAGPMRTGSYLQILNSRIEMYQTILDIIKGEGWDATGVYLENAERFLFDCCTTSVKRVAGESDLYDKESEEEFIKTVEETNVAIRKLQPVVSEWIVIMDKVDNELTHDGSRHSAERAASFMLMKWASIVTVD